MELQMPCIVCNIQQVHKVLQNIQISKEKQRQLQSAVLAMLSEVDYGLCNPEVMKKTWDIICEYVEDNDPYQSIKTMYNQELLQLYPKVKELVLQTKDPLVTAIKMSALANIIDFSAKERIVIEDIWLSLEQAEEVVFDKDDTAILKQQLEQAKIVLYIGDNCGEIVIDKLCIEMIKENYDCEVYYIVRQEPIINDVTMIDAHMVHMEDVAHILPSGDSSLGMVLPHTSETCKALFKEADVVIAKGQGNFEGLQTVDKEYLFHVFMVKCKVIEDIVQVPQQGIVCLQK